jgi:TonB family protein
MKAALLLVMLASVGIVAAQAPCEAAIPERTTPRARIRELAPLVYPPVARQARISGTVVVDVVLRTNGEIDSASVVKGHPMLKVAALENARNSKFECPGCTEPQNTRRIQYSFELGDAIYCGSEASSINPTAERRFPSVRQLSDRIVVFDRPVGTCDLETTRLKVRAAKCLYLWRCGTR